MNVRDSFNAAQSHAIQVHLDAQLSHIVRVAPRSVGFEKLTTAVLAYELSLFTTTVLDCFGGVAVWTLHISIPTLILTFFSNAFLDCCVLSIREAAESFFTT